MAFGIECVELLLLSLELLGLPVWLLELQVGSAVTTGRSKSAT